MNAGRQPAVAVLRNDCHSFAAVGITGVDVGTTGHAASVHVHFGAVGKSVFHRIRIKILIDVRVAIGALAIMASTQGLGFDWPGVLHHADVIDVVDVEIAEAPAAEPDEAVKT